MTPEHSPFPIAVSEASSLVGLEEIANWMREKRVGYVIAKDRKKHPSVNTQSAQQLYVLWRAEVPSDKVYENLRNDPRVIFAWGGALERGKTDGPKPGTAKWRKRIVETWEP